jgi:hypothetical protein
MTRTIYLRFLFAAIMLLMAGILINYGPASQAAQEQTLEECFADCDAWYDSCVAAGRTDCVTGRFRCYRSCQPTEPIP